MPPRPKATQKTAVRVAPNGYKLADPVPLGEVVVDIQKNRWMIGPVIATGGFGDIYVSQRIGENERAVKTPKNSIEKASSEWPYVMKVDRDSGPLFAEINFYIRCAKQKDIDEWKESKHLSHLGMPHYVSSGRHLPAYRFLVLQRFKTDLDQYLKAHPLTVRQTLSIVTQVIDIVEYIHSRGYIHCDIKASNLLLATEEQHKPTSKKDPQMKVYLVDFGNVEKFELDGAHRQYEEDLRRAHNGTLEFCSRDAHVGALSRRTDLECLGYNLLFWLVEDLPWKHEKSHEQVFALKKDYMANVTRLVEYCLNLSNKPPAPSPPQPENSPPKQAKRGRPPKKVPPPVLVESPSRNKSSKGLQKILTEYMKRVTLLEFDQKPDYTAFKSILSGSLDKGELDSVLTLSNGGHARAVNGNGIVANGDEPVAAKNGAAKNGNKSPVRGIKRKPSADLANGHLPNGNVNGHHVNGHAQLVSPKVNGNQHSGGSGHSSKPATPPEKVSALKKRVITLNPTPAMLEVMRRMESSAR